MAMRLNEFQAHVVRGQQFPNGIVERTIVAGMEGEIAQLLVMAARMAHTMGTDLDTIAAVYLIERDCLASDAAPQPAPANVEHHPV